MKRRRKKELTSLIKALEITMIKRIGDKRMKKGGRQREKRDIRKICIKKGQENKDRERRKKKEKDITHEGTRIKN